MGKIKLLNDGSENIYPVTTDEAIVVSYEDSEGNKVGTLKEYVEHTVNQGIGGISADDILDTAITAGVAVGNVVKNQTFAVGTTVEQVLQAIFNPFSKPIVTASCSVGDAIINGETPGETTEVVKEVTTDITYTVKLNSIPYDNVTSFEGNGITIAFSNFTKDSVGNYVYKQTGQTCTATKTFTGKLTYKDPRTNASDSVSGSDVIRIDYPMYYLGLKINQNIDDAIKYNGTGAYPGIVTYKGHDTSKPTRLTPKEYTDGAFLVILSKTRIKQIYNELKQSLISSDPETTNFTESEYIYNGVKYYAYTYVAACATKYNLTLTYY